MRQKDEPGEGGPGEKEEQQRRHKSVQIEPLLAGQGRPDEQHELEHEEWHGQDQRAVEADLEIDTDHFGRGDGDDRHLGRPSRDQEVENVAGKVETDADGDDESDDRVDNTPPYLLKMPQEGQLLLFFLLCLW